jgi:hypothetical protein
MPAQVLDDRAVADVLTFVTNSWGNKEAPFTVEEVRAVRAQSQFPSYEALVQATTYRPLPAAPAGWKVREVVQLPDFCTRLASDGKGENIYVLQQNGAVLLLNVPTATLLPIIAPEDYMDAVQRGCVALGCTVDPDGRLLVVTNRHDRDAQPLALAEIIIWRSSEVVDGRAAKLLPWVKTSYPQGIGGYNHGVSHIAFGPDGMLYLSSGSRTDGGEPGTDPHYFQGGEVENTACLWRINPKAEQPRIEALAPGIRNAYGFAWDGKGNLFTVSNGPDASAPEEMDFIEPGKHYGFPYQFSDWPVKPRFPYKHTPPPPDGVHFTHPVVNVGPAAGGKSEGIGTFDAHSSPAGMIWCGEEYPAPLGGAFLITRFGNLLGAPAAPEDVGFDVISARLERNPEGKWQARVETVLSPLGRPLDVHAIGGGRVLILEYTRPTNFKEKLGWLPGRIIELAPEG